MGNDKSVHLVGRWGEGWNHLVQCLIRHGFSVTVTNDCRAFLERPDDNVAGCAIVEAHASIVLTRSLIDGLVERTWRIPVIAVVHRGDVARTVEAIRAGAIDVIEHPCESETMLRTVIRTFDRADEMDEKEARRAGDRSLDTMSGLTRREREVTGLIVDGLTNKDIARHLGISYRTVEVHRANLMRKLGARTTADLVRSVVALTTLDRIADDVVPEPVG